VYIRDMTDEQEKVGKSRHAEMQDFDWVRGGPSPHWRLLSLAEGLSEDDMRLLDSPKDMDLSDLLARLLPKDDLAIQHA
jgi:hypothetical protein